MGRRSRSKGARGERELAARLRELGWASARRGQQFAGGPDSPDIAGAISGVHIECKRVERLNLAAAMEQAESDAGALVPLVASRRNRGPWLVTVRLEDLRQLAGLVMMPPDGSDQGNKPPDD